MLSVSSGDLGRDDAVTIDGGSKNGLSRAFFLRFGLFGIALVLMLVVAAFYEHDAEVHYDQQSLAFRDLTHADRVCNSDYVLGFDTSPTLKAFDARAVDVPGKDFMVPGIQVYCHGEHGNYFVLVPRESL